MLDALASEGPAPLTPRWLWVCLEKMADSKSVALCRILEGIKDGIFVVPD